MSRRAAIAGGVLWVLGVGLVVAGMLGSWTRLDQAAVEKALGIEPGAIGGVLSGGWEWDTPAVGLTAAAVALALIASGIVASPRHRRGLIAGGVLATLGVLAATGTLLRALDEPDPEFGVVLDWPGPSMSTLGAAAMIAGGAVFILGGRRPRRGPVPQPVS